MHLHIANTFFEWELEGLLPARCLAGALDGQKTVAQLQMLPVAYAQPGDLIGVTHLPPLSYRQQWPVHFVEVERVAKEAAAVELWGASRLAATWADGVGLPLLQPPWEVVQASNSKASFIDHLLLPTAILVYEEEQLLSWLAKQRGPCVLKSCYGMAGKGRALGDPCLDREVFLRFARREWAHRRPLCVQPWLQRVCDFSTQWRIEPGGTVLFEGVTAMENTSSGLFVASLAGPPATLLGSYERFLPLHLDHAEQVLAQLVAWGYFGHVGIDALVWLDERGRERLCPVVEVNARKTMGWVALKLQRCVRPRGRLALRWGASEGAGRALLPPTNGRQLFLQAL